MGGRDLFPYSTVCKDIKIQIYGAGDSGKSYVYELLHSSYTETIKRYDKKYNNIGNYAGIEIQNPEKIENIISDMVLVAIQNENGNDNQKLYWLIRSDI